MNHSFKGIWKKGLWVANVWPRFHMPAVLKLEEECFPENLRATEDMFESLFYDSTQITKLLFHKGRLVGLISGTRVGLDNTPENIFSLPDLSGLHDTIFYMESLSLSEESRNLQNLLYLFQEMAVELRKSGYRFVAADARVNNGFSRKMQKIFKAKLLSRDPDWQGLGEPFEYLLIDLDHIPSSSRIQRFIQRFIGGIWRLTYW